MFRYNENKYEEAVDLLTTAYIVNEKVLKEELACTNPAVSLPFNFIY